MQSLRATAVRAVTRVMEAADRAGLLRQSEQSLIAESQAYWRGSDRSWSSNSHWRSGEAYSEDTWLDVGRCHWSLYEKAARLFGRAEVGRVVEWGAGGGANAVAFAPYASAFVAVDVAQSTLDECRRQTEAACSTPFTGVLIDVDDPERALDVVPPADLFLCFYVLELVPSQQYGLRIVDIAGKLLRAGGLAILQIKYDAAGRPHSWNHGYRRHLGEMTSYPIDTFWNACAERGLQPEFVHLVPRNALDARYAYFVLSKPQQQAIRTP